MPADLPGLSIIRHSDLAVSPWANGAGTTRQVAAEPEGSTIDSFDWRVSIADVVRECSFSAFPGIDRTILLVEGRVMVLAINGVECRLEPLAPVRFGGEAEVTCSVPDGPTRDLNVMCRRGEWAASVEVLDARKPVSVAPTSKMIMFLACFAGQWSLVEPAAHRLGPGDFLRVGCTATVQAAEPVILIRLARSRGARAFGAGDDGAAG
ncbi:unannotated protein [freshwater metagenome]|uniref:Unannotated protein n=1 Tax=freshwater metagenome TaxID=449393 RepID=A0A6J6UFW0_9ZZZZ